MVFCGTYGTILSMTIAERQAVLESWASSRLPLFRKIYRGIFSLSVLAYVQGSELASLAMRRPLRELNPDDPDRYLSKQFYRFEMLRESDLSGAAYDAVVVGSGAGAGVVAARLATEGFSVLVVEKGKYYHQAELHFSESEGMANLYEGQGIVTSDDQAVTMLAGATFGGGTTINWSASIRTQDYVRQEWAAGGVEFYGTRAYDDALDSVCARMGVSDKYLSHSRANRLLWEGSQRIGSRVSLIPQNTNGATHRCGFCSFGCRFGEKQGCVNSWLVDAGKAGARFVDQATVERVIVQNGKATGVRVGAFGKTFDVKASVVVVAAGTLHTPVVLRNSGLRNKHIGSHLKLHPVNFLHGIWNDGEFNLYNEAIMTAVNTECENLDGHGHGVKIEAMLQHPTPLYSGFPWTGPESLKVGMMKFNNMASYVLLARDAGEGKVFTDAATGRPRVSYQLSKIDRQHLAIAAIHAAKICIAADADEVYTSDRRIPHLVVTPEIREKRGESAAFKQWASAVERFMAGKYTAQLGSAHQMGTCRLGPSASTSAAKVTGELWECRDLYVADASALPSASGANPMVSIMATAYVISGEIVRRLRAKQTRL